MIAPVTFQYSYFSVMFNSDLPSSKLTDYAGFPSKGLTCIQEIHLHLSYEEGKSHVEFPNLVFLNHCAASTLVYRELMSGVL